MKTLMCRLLRHRWIKTITVAFFVHLPMTLPAPAQSADALSFDRHQIATYPDGYQVDVADLNNDGRPDVIGLSTEADRVDWFENPEWTSRPIARTSRNIDLAPHDIDGDGQQEIALASGFYYGDSTRGGRIQWLEPSEDGMGNPWKRHEIAKDPVVHRLKWGDLDGSGSKELVHAPIFGPGSKHAVDPEPSHLWAFRPPETLRSGDWTTWTISERLTVLHGVHVEDLDGDGRDEVLTASFEGVFRFDAEGEGSSMTWRSRRIGSGADSQSDEPGAPRGSSEVAPGELSNGQQFRAAVEPWHGKYVVVYLKQGDGQWKRQVIDEALQTGHALVVEDLDRDGSDEIVAGWRGGSGGLALYEVTDESGASWRRQTLNRGLHVQAAVVADLNGDALPDIVVNGGSSNRIDWFEQTSDN